MGLSLLCLVDLKDEGSGQESVVASLKASGAPGESLVPVLSNRCADRTSPDHHRALTITDNPRLLNTLRGAPCLGSVDFFYDMRSLIIMLPKVI